MSRMPVTYKEEYVNAFMECVHAEGDRLYRFTSAITLDSKTAFACVEEAFAKVTTNFQQLLSKPADEVRLILLESCWKLAKGSPLKDLEAGPGGLFQALRKLDVESRAILTAVDVLGLSSMEACKVMELDEESVLRKLASARKTMLADS